MLNYFVYTLFLSVNTFTMNYIYIYGLIDPISNLIKYVGATNDLTIRYHTHLNSTPDASKRGRWLDSLFKQNLKPYLILLERTDLKNASQTEIKWIEHYKLNELVNYFPTVPYSLTADKTKLISIRLEFRDIIKLKELSDKLETGYQTLIKNWIKEKLESFS